MTPEQEKQFYAEMHAKAVEATREYQQRANLFTANKSQHFLVKALNEIVAPVIADVVKRAKQDAERIVALEARQAALEQRVAALEARAVPLPGPPAQASVRPLRVV
jgi:BMFP domain-containing protein YqiC